MNYDQAKAEFIKTITRMSGRYSTYEVFNDFVEMATYAISNSVCFNQKREDEYLRITKKYKPEEVNKFAELLGLIVIAFENKFGDFLGECFHSLNIHNKNAGQFFTPYHICQLMAKITIDKEVAKQGIEEQGYIGINEPTCGGGACLIAACERYKEVGINFQNQVLMIAQDIDFRCACMCYIQLSLLGASIIVRVGNTLMMEVREEFYSPIFMLNRWRFVKRNRITPKLSEIKEIEVKKPVEKITYKEDKKGQFSLF